MANKLFTLPPSNRQDVKSRNDIDKSGMGLQQIAESDGEYLATGLLPMTKASGQIDIIHQIHPAWLEINGYQGNYTGAVQAITDYDFYVAQGGLGYLTDVPMSVVYNTKTHAHIYKWTTTVFLYGQPEVVMMGPDLIQLTATYRCPRAYWVGSDGSLRTFSAIS